MQGTNDRNDLMVVRKWFVTGLRSFPAIGSKFPELAHRNHEGGGDGKGK
jgi:hypothetical protein